MGTTWLLVIFNMYPPNTTPDLLIQFGAFGIDLSGSERKRKRSSAYRETVCVCPALFIPIIPGSFLSAVARGS